MKRILKSIVDTLAFAGECICPSVLYISPAIAQDAGKAIPEYGTKEYFAFMDEVRIKHSQGLEALSTLQQLQKVIEHEKPTPNPYATYLCIDNNSK